MIFCNSVSEYHKSLCPTTYGKYIMHALELAVASFVMCVKKYVGLVVP